MVSKPGPRQPGLVGVVYDDAGEAKIVRPDFIFFTHEADDTVVADFVDPHGWHLANLLAKLRGLAAYAEKNGGAFRRIEAVAELDGRYRKLDLKKPEVRDAIASAASAKFAYAGPMGSDY